MPIDSGPIERRELAARLGRMQKRLRRAAFQGIWIVILVVAIDFGLAYAFEPPRGPRWAPPVLMAALLFMILPIAGWFDYQRIYDDTPWTRDELAAVAWETGERAGWDAEADDVADDALGPQ
jgi:hypothetical protein